MASCFSPRIKLEKALALMAFYLILAWFYNSITGVLLNPFANFH